jgi:hypothetical protein
LTVPTALITQAIQINDAGQIVGYANPRSGVNIGFLRSPSGTITSFQLPGAGLDFDEGTRSVVNASGTIAGYYCDANQVPHGFLRF